ncbi:putative L-ascorbate peroxidase 6, partial [Dichanthelium oligosanthes]
LVFHDAGTFDVSDKSGGMNGSIIYEVDRPENTGLSRSIKILGKAKAGIDDIQKVSWADLIAVAGAEAVALCGGPEIPVRLGRLDSRTQEMVVLSGAHTIGGKGFGSPIEFDNSYFKVLLEKKPQTDSYTTDPLKFIRNLSLSKLTVLTIVFLCEAGMGAMVGLPTDWALAEDDECLSRREAGDGMRLAATKPAAIFLARRQPVTTPRARVAAAATAAGPCSSEPAKKSRHEGAWRIAVASSDAEGDGGGSEDDAGAGAGQVASKRARGRRARLSARRRESVRLPDGVSGGDVGEFLRHPDGVESLLNTGALESFAPAAGSGPGTFTCVLRRIGFLGFEVAPVLDLRVAPTSTDCTIEMLSCRFEGSESVEQQNELFSAFMSNHITWSDNAESCLDIDVTLEVTLEVYTKPFSMLPLSAVEKPGNLYVDARPVGQACSHAGGAAAEGLPLLGSAAG